MLSNNVTWMNIRCVKEKNREKHPMLLIFFISNRITALNKHMCSVFNRIRHKMLAVHFIHIFFSNKQKNKLHCPTQLTSNVESSWNCTFIHTEKKSNWIILNWKFSWMRSDDFTTMDWKVLGAIDRNRFATNQSAVTFMLWCVKCMRHRNIRIIACVCNSHTFIRNKQYADCWWRKEIPMCANVSTHSYKRFNSDDFAPLTNVNSIHWILMHSYRSKVYIAQVSVCSTNGINAHSHASVFSLLDEQTFLNSMSTIFSY